MSVSISIVKESQNNSDRKGLGRSPCPTLLLKAGSAVKSDQVAHSQLYSNLFFTRK